MTQRNETIADVILSRRDWEEFLSSLERLINLHRRVLQRLKDLEVRNVAMRTELRSALTLPTLEPIPEAETSTAEVPPPVRSCLYCGNDVATSARFCDRCGGINAVLVCNCGNELYGTDRFCDQCGRPVILT